MKITFDNIAGYELEKKEALEICKIIKNYEYYRNLGITLPKGLLFYGKSGVGKTLFAKAMATEVNRIFIDVDITRTNEGDFKDYLREKFQEAHEKSPAIIFIDELDKLVPMEGGRVSFISDKTRGTLTLLLSLLDGFDKKSDVMLIATANTIDSMPDALVRPGRIDKFISLSLPDKDSRLKIIEYYLNNLKLEKDLDLEQFVLITESLSGADIKTIINETAIEAVNSNSNIITTSKVIEFAGRIEGKQIPKHKKGEVNQKEIEIVAYHELGHFITANVLEQVIKDVSIVRVNNVLGKVRLMEGKELLSKEDVFNKVIIFLGGRAAEEVFFGKTFTGSYGDMIKAKLTLLQSVAGGDYGFEYVGIIEPEINYPSSILEAAHQEAAEILKKAYEEALRIIKENKELIEKLLPKLLEEGTLTGIQLSKYVKGIIKKDAPPEKDHKLELFERIFSS